MRAYMHLSMSVGKDQGFSILQSRISEGLVKEPDSCEKRLFISFLFFFSVVVELCLNLNTRKLP